MCREPAQMVAGFRRSTRPVRGRVAQDRRRTGPWAAGEDEPEDPKRPDSIGPRIEFDFLKSLMRRFRELERPLCVHPDARRSNEAPRTHESLWFRPPRSGPGGASGSGRAWREPPRSAAIRPRPRPSRQTRTKTRSHSCSRGRDPHLPKGAGIQWTCGSTTTEERSVPVTSL